MSMKREDRVCGKCIYFDEDEGFCRRNSPYRGETKDKWPDVYKIDWCGAGLWEGKNDVTGKLERYSFEAEELSYWEHQDNQIQPMEAEPYSIGTCADCRWFTYNSKSFPKQGICHYSYDGSLGEDDWWCRKWERKHDK